MARLVRNFIGGITAKVTGGETYDVEAEPKLQDDLPPSFSSSTKILRENRSPEGGKRFSSSDEDEGEMLDQPLPSLSGTLSKWTNYLQGWQDRYVVVRKGILSYYKSEYDTRFGCRGSISLHKVKLLVHEFDDVRFDIRAHDCTYFFRASTPEEKQTWIEVIEANKKYLEDTGYSPPITRQGSILSLSALSQASTSSFKRGHDLQVKISEMETYREILCRQIDTLQVYFDTLAAEANTQAGLPNAAMNGASNNSDESLDELPEEDVDTRQDGDNKSLNQKTRLTNGHTINGGSGSTNHSPVASRVNSSQGHRRTGSDPFAFRPHHLYSSSRTSHPRFTIGGNTTNGSSATSPTELSNIDFRGEALTFKATTAGILSSLAHCLELMSERERYWQKKYDKELEKRRKAERAAHSAINGPRAMAYEYSGPDLQEGPHSVLNEEEFFDALEIAYHEDEKEKIKNGSESKNEKEPARQTNDQAVVSSAESSSLLKITHHSKTGVVHRLTPLVDEKVTQYSQYIFEPTDGDNWSLVHEDVDMKVYRREMEEQGVVVDPLKAQYTAKGLSAFEVIKFFFDKETRLQWEGTLESVKVTETLAEDTVIFHQMHKRVWPSTQRETLFCSHLCTLSDTPHTENMVGHTWMVCNFSLEHDSVPITNKVIRATLHVGMVCQTIANSPVEEGKEKDLTREDVSCKIMYAANVNPGGWAPPSVVRAIAKREISKFLRKFSSTVQRAVADTPLTI